MARAKNLIGKVATVRLQMVDTQQDAQAAASSGIVPFGSTLYRFQGRPVLLKNQIVLPGTAIISAASILDQNGRPAVSIRAGGGAVTKFNRITAANIGKPMATVYVEKKSYKLLVKGKVVVKYRTIERIINIATIQSALGNSFQITGMESQLASKNLALLLRSGAYTAQMSFAQERLLR